MSEQDRNTLEGIMEAAKREFLEVGFKDARLRTIAANAGVTTGALYRYFSSKEELFGALVSSTYYGLIDIYRSVLGRFQQIAPEEQAGMMGECTAEGVKEMMDFIYENRDAMKLILCSSEGTEYSGLVHEMAKLDTDATHDFADDSHKAGLDNVKLVSPKLEHMLTSGMFSMFFEIIVHDVDRSEADDLVRDLIAFYSAGWQRLMGF